MINKFPTKLHQQAFQSKLVSLNFCWKTHLLIPSSDFIALTTTPAYRPASMELNWKRIRQAKFHFIHLEISFFISTKWMVLANFWSERFLKVSTLMDGDWVEDWRVNKSTHWRFLANLFKWHLRATNIISIMVHQFKAIWIAHLTV